MAAQARGVVLGSTGKDRAKENKAEADNFARDMMPVIRELRESGIKSVRATVEALNDRGIQTARGGSWHVPTVQRLLKRIETTIPEKAGRTFLGLHKITMYKIRAYHRPFFLWCIFATHARVTTSINSRN